MSKVNANGLGRGVTPFGRPKSIVSIGEIGFIITYGLIRTSYLNSDVYVNTSGNITNSSTNALTYLGVSNKYGDILFNGLNVSKKEEKKIRAEGSTFGEFVNFCKSYGTSHSGMSSGYTMKGYGWISWSTSSSNTSTSIRIHINDVDVAHHGSSSSTGFVAGGGPISLHPGDTVSWSNTGVLFYDYY